MSRSCRALLVVCLLLALLNVGQTLAQKSPPSVAEIEPASGTSNLVRLPIIYNGWEPSPRVISCLGDSVTHGYPYFGTEKTYPARLQAVLDSAHGPESFEVINHGVTLYRADQVLADLQALNWMDDDPDFVLLMVGGNDLAQETPFLGLSEVIERTVGEVQAIIDVVKSHTNADGSQPTIIVSAFIPNLILDYWGSDAMAQYNASLESTLTGVDLWTADNWDDFYDPTTEQARISLMSDLVHPNVEGYRVVAQNWFEAIEALLSTSGKPTVDEDVPTKAESSAGFDRWLLWTGETQLRGANIYHRSP